MDRPRRTPSRAEGGGRLTSPLLTEQDLVALTHLERPSAQARWLTECGIAYRQRNDGSIMTTWDAINAPLVGTSRTRPNLDAMRKAG